MDLVDELKAFVATAQSGSFTAAADRLRVSNRLTSKYVRELEARLGVRLLQRTTRKVGLTPAGADLLARAPAVLDELDDVLAEISAGSREVSGTIRVAAPVTLGETYVSGTLARFGAMYPDLVLDLRLSDRYVDLASEGIDTNRRSPNRWMFSKGGEDLSVPVAGRYLVNSAHAACSLAAAGHGVTYSPRFALASALNSGRLALLLQDYEGEAVPVNAVYLEGRTLPRRVRSLINSARDDTASRLPFSLAVPRLVGVADVCFQVGYSPRLFVRWFSVQAGATAVAAMPRLHRPATAPPRPTG